MPKKIVLSMTSEEIKTKIEENKSSIEELSAKVKELKKENRTLIRNLDAVEAREKEELAKKDMEEIMQIVKDTGMTLDEFKKLLRR